MLLREMEHRLLLLHYIYPAPGNRFESLLKNDPTLRELMAAKSGRIAELLGIDRKKAERIRSHIQELAHTPLADLYEKQSITPIPFTHTLYPSILKQMIDPPAVLYAKGDLALLTAEQKVAVIGSRKATDYTKEALAFIAPPLVEKGAVIVSGLARGADTYAHESAIFYGGKTIAVLGHGFSHLYPRENRKLAEVIAQNHLLLTEYPPYVKPARWTFPMRNRIISGLSDAVVVTEAAEKSGTMITIDHALEHGKTVYAVPGPITSTLSHGPNRLIDEGARPVWNGFQLD